MRRKHGFTLVEVLFVVLIAAGVLAFAMPAYKRMQEHAQYDAALGTLLDIDNAVKSLKQDLELATGKSTSGILGTKNFIKNGDAEWGGTQPTYSEGETTPWNAKVMSLSGDNRRKAFMWALHEFGYLKPLQNTQAYDFYILNPEASSGYLSKCKIDSTKVGSVCMYEKGNTSTPDRLTGCYLGAVVYPDGSVTRIKGTKSGGCGAS